MTNQIVNAAPMVIDRGTQDLSTRLVPREQELIPQHLPKFYLWAEKGPSEPQLVVGGERDRIYGSETFNPLSKFANHATIFANLANGKANTCMIERLIPDDAGPEANMTLWLDVLPAQLDRYKRNADYSLMLTAKGDPIMDTGKVTGYLVKWVVTSDSTSSELGLALQKQGDQTSPTGTVISQRYPIFQFKTSSRGEYGNNSGIRISAPTTKTTNSMPTKLMSVAKAYPYNISVIHRLNKVSTPKVIETLFGEQRLPVTFKPDTIDPVTFQRMYIGDKFVDSYQNIQDLRYPKLFGEFNQIKVYDEHIETLTKMFQAAEIPFMSFDNGTLKYREVMDFDDDLTKNHLFNFVSGQSSNGIPYYSFQFALDGVPLSDLTNHYAGGGSDGTLTNLNHDTMVRAKVLEYLDPNHKVQELAVNVESIMYDSGYSPETKIAMISFITERKDTFLVLGTHSALGTVVDPKTGIVPKYETVLTASQEHSLAAGLRSAIVNAPESDYFGTPVMRAMIVGRSGKLRNSLYKQSLSLTAEILLKSCAYMGAGNGRWKNGFHFDGAPGSVLEYMYDINITWVPASVRNKNWDVGLNWVQSYDRRSYFFPALKTAYDNDTSVLNSYFTAMAICQLNKVAHSAWREFTGVANLTNAQLEDRVNEFVISRTAGRFDNRFVIKPDASHTDMDVLRGYSWTLPIKIYAPNMKTVMTTFVQAYRISDLDGQ